jgi:uncharacterized cysteine cluster protein YcgN (CxxCxxCC family)
MPEITCTGCGSCCMHLGTPPFHSYEWPTVFKTDLEGEPCGDDGADSPEVLALFAEIAALEKDQTHYPDGPCSWFDPETGQCKHYDYRPNVCEDFEVGGEDCLRFRGECGVDRGLIPLTMVR